MVMLPTMVVAHTAGCCGDIPESLIWSLSLFLLIGFAVVASTYSSYPSPPSESAPPQIVYIKILPDDLKKVVNAFKHTNDPA
jgi:hypothetical protein